MSRVGVLLRDRPDTVFSRLLERLLAADDGVLAAVFVDDEGECIDYASRIDPFEAQVLGAVLSRTTAELAGACVAQTGETARWLCRASERDLLVQRVTAEHSLVVAVDRPYARARVARALPEVVGSLRAEAALPAPAWEDHGPSVQVETRAARGWPYAPRSYTDGAGVRREVEVLGRYLEPGTALRAEAICFRVRAGDEELTLTHLPAENRWAKQ